MKAFVINRYSKADNLQLIDLPQPELMATEVLIEVHSASINQLDVKLKGGEFKLILPYKFPLILGHDVAGVVTRVGSEVRNLKTGDEVFARPADLSIGSFAEYIAVNENAVAKKPKTISMEEAASLPLVALTAWQALMEKAKLQKGQKVFIQAGSGGVGTLAIQLAKHLGATVATTTSAANINLVRSLGADVVIDYKKENFETMLQNYDLVLHSQDEKTLKKSLRILKPGGKIVSISGPPDVSFAKEKGLPWFMKMALFFLSGKVKAEARRLHVDYSFLFMRSSGNQLSEISTLIDAGAIKPIVDRIFSFEQINEAMAYVASGRSKGKVVVKLK